MQPCPVCGGLNVAPNGYCMQCGTFRGVPVKRKSAVPIVPLVVALIVVVLAITTLVVVRLVMSKSGNSQNSSLGTQASAGSGRSTTGGKSNGGNSGGGAHSSPNPAAPGTFDQCLLGKWKETVGKRKFLNEVGSGAGAVATVDQATGLTMDYGEGVTYKGERYTVVAKGKLVYDAVTEDGELRLKVTKNNATYEIPGPGGIPPSRWLTTGTELYRYQCDAKKLVISTEEFRFEGDKQ